jgi:hypothetical protein
MVSKRSLLAATNSTERESHRKERLVCLLAIGLLALSSSAFGQRPIPGDARSVGLHYIVPDVACWFDAVGNFVTNGFVKLDEAAVPAEPGNWEPYTGVVGDSAFLIGFNTYANDGTFAHQSFVVAKQPDTGGPARLDYEFWDDSGNPVGGLINLSRQNGNPQRVAGDKRPGATTFITQAEVSIGQLPEFQLVPRWGNNNIYQGINRYAAEQIFTLDPLSLGQTPVANAWDYVYGPFVGSMGSGNGAPQCTRTGGRCDFLDNGNIVVMLDDKTCISSPASEVTTFAIIEPNGNIVKGPTLVDPRDMWDNMCAFKGGFCIRVYDAIYFYDSDGNLKHVNNLAVANANLETAWGLAGLSYYTDRGDTTRVASDIRSRYVYMAGGVAIPGSYANRCMMAVWDAWTGAFVTNALVSSDLDPSRLLLDRTALAVSAENDICVVYAGIADTTVLYNRQAIARVLNFNGQRVTPRTPSFFAFVNSDNRNTVKAAGGTPQGFLTFTPNVSMTTKAICIAAKGWINSINNPAGGPDTAFLGGNTTVYTVISRPALPALSQ